MLRYVCCVDLARRMSLTNRSASWTISLASIGSSKSTVRWLGGFLKLPIALHAHNTFNQAMLAYQPESDRQFLLDRLSDAWAWLEARGLIGHNPTSM